MVSITKSIFRTVLIGGLVLGGATLIVGPHRMTAGLAQVKHTAITWFDSNLDDPVVIREQLRRLEQEYPERIREMQRSVSEVEGHIAALKKDNEVSTRVIGLAREDLTTLASLVERARSVQNASFQYHNGVTSSVTPVLVQFDGRNITVEQAYERGEHLKKTAIAHHDRLAANSRDLALLESQRERLVKQLTEIKDEYANFQSEVWQIERQLAAKERNEQLIEWMQDREELFAESAERDRFDVSSLKQIRGRLDQEINETTAVLESMSSREAGEDLVKRAEKEIALEQYADSFNWDLDRELESRPMPALPVVITTEDVQKSSPNSVTVDEKPIARSGGASDVDG